MAIENIDTAGHPLLQKFLCLCSDEEKEKFITSSTKVQEKILLDFSKQQKIIKSENDKNNISSSLSSGANKMNDCNSGLAIEHSEETVSSQNSQKHSKREDLEGVYSFVTDSFEDVYQRQTKNLNNLEKKDGWAANLADGIKSFFGSDNTSEKVHGDIENMHSKFQSLAKIKNTASKEEFAAKFKEVTGNDFDENKVTDVMSDMKSYKSVVSNNKKLEDIDKILNLTFNNNNLSQIEEQLGGQKSLEEILGEGYKNASDKDKFAIIKKLAEKAKFEINKENKNILKGKDFKTFTNQFEKKYTDYLKMLGADKIGKRISDFRESQETGAQWIKTGSIIGTAAAVTVLSGGLGAIAFGGVMAGASAAAEITDRASNDVDDLGAADFLDIAKNSAVDGVVSGTGLGVAGKILGSGMKSIAKIGTMTGVDASLGAGAEYLKTGEVTAKGMAINAAFSVAGNSAALYMIGKANAKQVVSNQIPKEPETNLTLASEKNIPSEFSKETTEFLRAVSGEKGIVDLEMVTTPGNRNGSVDNIVCHAARSENSNALTDASALLVAGGREISILDFKEALQEGRSIIILKGKNPNNVSFDEKSGQVNNTASYLESQINAVLKGEELPYPEIEAMGKDFLSSNRTKLLENVLILDTDDKTAVSAASNFLKGKIIEAKGLAKQPLTEVDNDMVIDARYKDVTVKSLDPAALSDEFQEKLLTPFIKEINAAKKEKKLVIVTGRAAAGKSTILRELQMDERSGYFLADSDRIKPLLPGFDENGANSVHTASSFFNQILLQTAATKGANITMPTIGNTKILGNLVRQAKKEGYEVTVVHVNVDEAVSLTRAVNRFVKGEDFGGEIKHRYIEPMHIIAGKENVEKVPSWAKESSDVDNIIIYDNNIDGKSPKVVEKIKKNN